MKKKLAPLAENVGESAAACLITMTQGNILAFGVAHWVIASQTGLVAGVLASIALMLARTDNRWVIAIMLGTITAVVDYFIHPEMFGPEFLEPILTGLAAAMLSFLIGTAMKHWREWRASRA